MKRRSFLKTVGGAVGGATLGAPSALVGDQPAVEVREEKTAVLPRRLLGRTGKKVSIVGFPGLALIHDDQDRSTAAIHDAFERGVNYFDVAPAYGNGDAEVKMGVGLQGIDRSSIFLACKTKVKALAADGEEIVVEPIGNMPVVKDLVVDMAPFWQKVRAVEPWLQPDGPAPEREHLVAHDIMRPLAEIAGCILCGACVSDCAVLETELGLGKPSDQTFLGPAALAKGYRFVADPRDGAAADRLRALTAAEGIWDCTRCNICVEVCPKGVAPLEQILALRRKAIEQGYDQDLGARHTLEFEKTVRETSWI